MDAYGLPKNEIERVIKIGMKWKEKDTEKWHAKMAGIECVFVKQEDMIYVITVYTVGG